MSNFFNNIFCFAGRYPLFFVLMIILFIGSLIACLYFYEKHCEAYNKYDEAYHSYDSNDDDTKIYKKKYNQCKGLSWTFGWFCTFLTFFTMVVAMGISEKQGDISDDSTYTVSNFTNSQFKIEKKIPIKEIAYKNSDSRTIILNNGKSFIEQNDHIVHTQRTTTNPHFQGKIRAYAVYLKPYYHAREFIYGQSMNQNQWLTRRVVIVKYIYHKPQKF